MDTTEKRSAASIAAVIGLLALFAILSRSAVLTKSATHEEPLNAAAGWTYVHARDYRASPESPPFAKLVSAALHDPLDLSYSTRTLQWRALPANPRFQSEWAARAVFRSPAVTGDAFIQRARLPMLVFGLGLGALVAIWAWMIGGATASLVATTLFAFSPAFIGHSSLVTADVALAFAWLAVGFTAWHLGARITLARITLLALAVSCALLVKFSGLLAIPLAAGLLALRASEQRPWLAGRTELSRGSTRAVAAIVVTLEIAVVCWALVWCAYGLRFSSTAEETPLDFDAAAMRLAEATLRAEDPAGLAPAQQELAALPLGATARFALYSQSHSLLPEAWNYGLLACEEASVAPLAFPARWPGYSAIVMLCKEPSAAVAGIVAACALATLWFRRREIVATEHSWLISCLAAPPLLCAMTEANGTAARHLLPILPFAFIAAGVVGARAVRLYGRTARRVIAILLTVTAIETLAAWPDFIAFFNVPAGVARGGLRFPGDANLDWGQDLKLLAAWQQRSPTERLYLAYSGTADPSGYGITYVNVLGAYRFGPPREPMSQPGTLAISAAYLQGVAASPELESLARELREREPLEVLGGTIYLYAYEGERREAKGEE